MMLPCCVVSALVFAFVYEGTGGGVKVAEKELLGVYSASVSATAIAFLMTVVATAADLPAGALLVPTFVAVDSLRSAPPHSHSHIVTVAAGLTRWSDGYRQPPRRHPSLAVDNLRGCLRLHADRIAADPPYPDTPAAGGHGRSAAAGAGRAHW